MHPQDCGTIASDSSLQNEQCVQIWNHIPPHPHKLLAAQVNQALAPLATASDPAQVEHSNGPSEPEHAEGETAPTAVATALPREATMHAEKSPSVLGKRAREMEDPEPTEQETIKMLTEFSRGDMHFILAALSKRSQDVRAAVKLQHDIICEVCTTTPDFCNVRVSSNLFRMLVWVRRDQTLTTCNVAGTLWSSIITTV